MKTIEELAIVYSDALCTRNPMYVEFSSMKQEWKDDSIYALRAAIDAYLESVGEMPSEEDIEMAYNAEEVRVMQQAGSWPAKGHKEGIEAVRRLMLAAFAKAIVEKDKRIAELQAKLDDLAKLPEKWRKQWNPLDLGFLGDRFNKELEAVLNPAPPADPYAHLKAAEKDGKTIQIRDTLRKDANNEWVWHDQAAGLNFNLPIERYRIKPDAPVEEWEKLGPDDVPPGSYFKFKNGEWFQPDTFKGGCYCNFHFVLNLEQAFKEGVEVLRPGSTWQPCRKLKQPKP